MKLKTVNIKGKEYVQVNERVRAFREVFPKYRLISEIISVGEDGNGGGIVTMKASVLDENGNVLATGHAQEKEASSNVNRTSYIENCETSAFGRALGNLGIGIDTSFATADEVESAIEQQEEIKREEKERREADAARADEINENFNLASIEPMATKEQIESIIKGCDITGTIVASIPKHYGVEALENLTQKQAKEALMRLSNKANRQADAV